MFALQSLSCSVRTTANINSLQHHRVNIVHQPKRGNNYQPNGTGSSPNKSRTLQSKVLVQTAEEQGSFQVYRTH